MAYEDLKRIVIEHDSINVEGMFTGLEGACRLLDYQSWFRLDTGFDLKLVVVNDVPHLTW